MTTSHRITRTTRMTLVICLAILLAFAALAALPSPALADEGSLPAPTKVKAKATKTCAAKVSWSKMAGATGYTIYWSKNKSKGYKRVGHVSARSTSFTHTAAIAGAKNYYRVAACNPSGDESLSKATGVKVGSTFKNSFVKFSIPKYWRGKVYVSEKKYNSQFKSVYIRDIKTGGTLARIDWSSRYNEEEGDVASHPVKKLRRGKGSVELWVNSWAMNLYYSKYVNRSGNPSLSSDNYDSSRELTNAETNRLIKLQTGGKFSYSKVKKVSDNKSTKYSEVADKYVAKNLKIKVVK